MTSYAIEILPSKDEPEKYFVSVTQTTEENDGCKIGLRVPISPNLTYRQAIIWSREMGPWTPEIRDQTAEPFAKAVKRFFQTHFPTIEINKSSPTEEILSRLQGIVGSDIKIILHQDWYRNPLMPEIVKMLASCVDHGNFITTTTNTPQ